MAKQRTRTAAQRRGDAVYAQRVAKVAPFTSSPFPSPAKATKADRARVLRSYKAIFGWGDTAKPIMSKHTTVVHLVATKAEERAAKKRAAAYNEMVLAPWKAAKARDPDSIAAMDKPTVRHVFQRASPAEVRRIKREVGQDTPAPIRSIFIRQEQVPGKVNQYSTGDVVRLRSGHVLLNGFQLIHFRPINPVRWIADPEREEARVMRQLREDFADIADHFARVRGWALKPSQTVFSPQVGNHRYLDALQQEDRVHDLLAHWRARYGTETSRALGRSPTAEWLRGINLIIFINRSGEQQFFSEWDAQQQRRALRKRLAHQMAAFRAPKRRAKDQAKATQKSLRRKRRR